MQLLRLLRRQLQERHKTIGANEKKKKVPARGLQILVHFFAIVDANSGQVNVCKDINMHVPKTLKKKLSSVVFCVAIKRIRKKCFFR